MQRAGRCYVRASSCSRYSSVVLRVTTMGIVDSRSATGVVCRDPVAVRPVEGVDTHTPPASRRPFAGRIGILPKSLSRSVASWQFTDCLAPFDRVTTGFLRTLEHRANGRIPPARFIGPFDEAMWPSRPGSWGLPRWSCVPPAPARFGIPVPCQSMSQVSGIAHGWRLVRVDDRWCHGLTATASSSRPVPAVEPPPFPDTRRASCPDEPNLPPVRSALFGWNWPR